MEPRTKKLLALTAVGVVLVVAVVAGGLWFWASSLYEDSYTSSYEYRLDAETNGTLSNVTLYLPVPVEDGESEIGDLFVEREVYEDTDAEETEPWNYSLVPTERGLLLEVNAERIVGRDSIILREFDDEGRLTRMREIEADEIPENTTNTDIVRRPTGYTRIAGVESDESIDTRSPLDNEPMLSPKENVSEVDCGVVWREYYYSTGERCYAYTSYVYADYDASSETQVSFSIELEGSNSWWIGGWSSNWYTDSVRFTHDGERNGWTATRGTYTEEGGSYR
ncbi:MAG: hypothetical protein U5J64_07440 [Halobacteriales archaeon]|nr:hypothetical protein [Halobacteriales archaeon]